MLGIQVRKPRFSLYHLEEGELFIKESAVYCQFVYPETQKVENLIGVLLIGSRSLIFEPDEHSFSIVKFHFRYMSEKPKIVSFDNKDMIKFKASHIIEIPKGNMLQPYKTHHVKSDVFINFQFEKLDTISQAIYELVDKFNSKSTSFEFDTIEYLGNLYSFQFDYTTIKSINEKFLLKREIFVKQILPLIEAPGLLMLTDARIYFQPLFTVNTKKTLSFKYSTITKLYKRRIKLTEVYKYKKEF